MKTTKILAILVLALVFGLTTGVTKAKLVACLGNSNTYGYGLPNQAYNCYPAQLERLLRQFDPNWKTRNFGVNGSTVLKQGDLPYMNMTAYAEALASEPDVVIFAFGGNESKPVNRGYIQESFISDYISLIDSFSKLPSKPKMWICYPLKIIGYSTYDVIVRDQIIPLIAEVASTKSIPLIDFYSVFEDLPHLYQSDRIHLTVEGAKLMAEMVAAAILGFRENPDLNSDGVVDSADICIMVDHWHTDEPSCDIAPPPFGDGIVDVQDLIVLAEHLFTYPGTVAYWKLDETEGDIAHDSAGNYDSTLKGNPVWQPEGGVVAGALQFDGIDDYISTAAVLNPAEGVFSVFAWVKGGTPGQVVLSQMGGVNWLFADSIEGNLMTELKGPGRNAVAMLSQKVITDGNWHRIGFVWDGSYRTLYVDGLAVAEDTQAGLEDSVGGLYIGAGESLVPLSFWSGLIDDVRIYNRAVKP